MADDDDFTFCPVRPPVDGVETQKAADEIRRINIDDGNGKAADEIRRINIDDGNGKAAYEIRRINIDDGHGNATDKSTYQSSDSIWKDGASSQKQEMVGSLPFKIIDASSRGALNQRPKQAAQVGASSSAIVLPEERTPPRKPITRAKVPFEKGYSQMGWLKLTRTLPDLAGLKGRSNKRLVSLSEVKQHQSEDSMWTVLKGRVYNIAPYMKFHPGGVDMLMKAVGKDCTSLFNKYHAWVNADFLLEKCLVGILEEDRRR